MMKSPLAIDLRAITKSFPVPGGERLHAVAGIDLAVRPGEVVAFLGPNGAGKSTTIDIMLGLGRPDSGEVRICGYTPQRAIESGLVGAVMQSGGFLPDFTVRETVAVVASTYGRTDIDDVLARTGLTEIANNRVSKCSGGQQQRLRYALATLGSPEVIILDEPTAGMDVEARRSFWNTMRADAQLGRTVLFATHYLEEADDFADRIVMVAQGRVVADGNAADIRAHASGRVVSAVLPHADIASLGTQFAITETAYRGDRTFFTTDDSDALARYLFTQTSAHSVEIVSRNLEDAFIALTSQAAPAATTAKDFA